MVTDMIDWLTAHRLLWAARIGGWVVVLCVAWVTTGVMLPAA